MGPYPVISIKVEFSSPPARRRFALVRMGRPCFMKSHELIGLKAVLYTQTKYPGIQNYSTLV